MLEVFERAIEVKLECKFTERDQRITRFACREFWDFMLRKSLVNAIDSATVVVFLDGTTPEIGVEVALQVGGQQYRFCRMFPVLEIQHFHGRVVCLRGELNRWVLSVLREVVEDAAPDDEPAEIAKWN